MMKFIDSTPLETLARVFPGFMNFALPESGSGADHSNPAAHENNERLINMQRNFEELLSQKATVKEFCHTAALVITDFLDRINDAFQSWMRTELDAEEFAALCKGAESQKIGSLMLIDVREDWERDIVALQGSIKFSSENAANILRQASSATHVIIYCHHGIRSLYAANYFQENGVPQARSLKGGIDAYASQVDGSLMRY